MASQLSNVEISKVFAGAVHDIKNSLSIFLSQLSEARNKCGGEACSVSRELCDLEYEAKRINTVAVKLLTLYKMSNQQYTLDIDSRLIAEFLEEIVVDHSQLLTSSGIQIEVECEADLVWYFDANLIIGAVSNAINNSYRYGRDRIRISAARDGECLRIMVEDNGDGYPPEIIERLEAIHEQRGGYEDGCTGLGLYFAQMSAELHRHEGRSGRMRLSNDSVLGGGRFALYLP